MADKEIKSNQENLPKFGQGTNLKFTSTLHPQKRIYRPAEWLRPQNFQEK